MSMLEERKESL